MLSNQVVTQEIVFVPVGDVEPNPFNPNAMDEEKRLELKAQMKKTTPEAFFAKASLKVTTREAFYGKTLDEKKGRGKKATSSAPYIFIDGQHRWQNTKELLDEKAPGWENGVVGVVVEQLTRAQVRHECYTINYLRGTTDPLKEAALFKEDKDDGMTLEEIADSYGKKPGYISASLSLLELPKSVTEFLYKNDDGTSFRSYHKPLTKTALEGLVGLPNDVAKQLAERAWENDWKADTLLSNAKSEKERIELDKKKAEALSHFVQKTCPICGGPVTFVGKDLTRVKCAENSYTEQRKLGLRNELTWGPLETMETILAKKVKNDDGKQVAVSKAMETKKMEAKSAAKSAFKKKPDWFKYEKEIDAILPKLYGFLWEFIKANGDNFNLERIELRARSKASTAPKTAWAEDMVVILESSGQGMEITLNGKRLRVSFETGKWKKGNMKTRVTVIGAEDEQTLQAVRAWLDRVMVGDAKPDDVPYTPARIASATPAPEEGEDLEEEEEEEPVDDEEEE